MYALVEIKGKQYKAEKDGVMKVDLFEGKDGDKVELDKVLMVSGEDNIKVGAPFVDGVKVNAVVQKSFKDKKVVVFKYKKRKGYRKTKGHRQQYTLLKVQDIIGA